MSTGRALPTSVPTPVLLESLKITGRGTALPVIHRFQALLAVLVANRALAPGSKLAAAGLRRKVITGSVPGVAPNPGDGP
jgi:hypothetical protein